MNSLIFISRLVEKPDLEDWAGLALLHGSATGIPADPGTGLSAPGFVLYSDWAHAGVSGG